MVIPEWFEETAKIEEFFGALGARLRFTREVAIRVHDVQETHLWMSGWTADYPDPDGFFRGLLEKWPLYRDEEVVDLLSRARSSQDQDERMRLYHDLDRYWVAEQAALVPIWYGRAILLRRPWVDGLWTNPLSRVAFDQAVVERDSGAAPETAAEDPH
jgi:ABC-type oligopeptide transport system substrate-binding subunit